MAAYSHCKSLYLKDVRLYLNEHKKPRRRINEPQKYLLPIKLITNENLKLVGQVINISYYLVRADITFKAINRNRLIEKILFNPNISLEMIEIGNKISLSLKAPLDIIWNKYLCINENEIYEIGFALYLKETQRQAWHKFYNRLQAVEKGSIKQLLQI